MNASTLTTALLKTPDEHPKPSNPQAIKDVFYRPLHDLRISVIDRCNFRCTYCMPENEYSHAYSFLKESEWLRFDEIVRLTRLFVRLGVRKIRITGGEPLLRPELAELISQLHSIPETEDLALTTNGVLLSKHLPALKKAGLKRITVSLDTLDEEIFRRMNGGKGKLQDVLDGIRCAEEYGYDSLKINAVVQENVNDHTLIDLVKFFRGTKHVLRFIEYMDAGNCNNWRTDHVVPSAEILKMIHQRFPLRPAEPKYHGEVAARYFYEDGEGEIGFISSVTQPFCGTCTRGRLSTDGKFYTCLFAETGKDLRNPLRTGANDQELEDIIKSTWKKREDRYSENRILVHSRHEMKKKVEMYQIGG